MTTLNKNNARRAAAGWRSTFSSLENRNYRWFWLSTLMSFTGMQMQVFARGWLAYSLTGSALALGWVTFAHGLPILLLSPVSGVIVDRLEKRNLLLATQVLAAVVNLAVAVLISMGAVQVWHLMVASALTGTVFAFNMPSRHSMVPKLVEPHQLMNAVALTAGAQNLTNIAAPALAGILVGIMGVDWVYYVSVMCYIISAVFTLLMPRIPISGQIGSSMKNVALDGYRYVRRSTVLSTLLLLAFALTIFGMPYQTLMPAFAVSVLKVGASELGILMAAIGVGALIGSIAVAAIGNYRHKGMMMLISAALFGGLIVLFGASNSFYLSLALLVPVGIANMVYGAATTTLLQVHVDDQMRGRVMGMYMISAGLLPVGVLAVGAVAEFTGVQLALQIGGGAMVLATILVALYRPITRKL